MNKTSVSFPKGAKEYQVNSSVEYRKSENFNVSKIQINSLQSAGNELFNSSESFLTELQATEAHAVYGGKKNKFNKGSRKGSKKGSRKGSGRGSNRGSGRPSIVVIPFPIGYHC